MIVASSGVVLSMPGDNEAAAVPLPEITSAAEQQQAPAPVEPVVAAAPAITGAQIADLALAPARDRATVLAEEEARQKAEQARDRDERGDDDGDRWDKLREEIRDACDDGRIRGPICRSN